MTSCAAELDDLVIGEIERTNGKVVKSTGDGIFAAFGAPSEAIAAAIAVQRSLAHRNQATIEPVSLPVGLATGEVVVENNDVSAERPTRAPASPRTRGPARSLSAG